jgi:hypothetical protein
MELGGRLLISFFIPMSHQLVNSPVVQLRYMPSYILVKLTHTRATPLEGLEDNVIPLELAITSYCIKVQQEGHTMQKTV